MLFKSTYGQNDIRFVDAVLNGFADDGGLILPNAFPAIPIEKLQSWKDFSYQDVVLEICKLYMGEENEKGTFEFDKELDMSESQLKSILSLAFSKFSGVNTVPISKLPYFEKNVFLCELFHGPTLAFKDLALQVMAGLFEHILSKRNQFRNLIVATSGDTGAAALEAFKNKKHIDIHCLYPDGMVSNFQKLQMTTVDGTNTHIYCVQGSTSDTLDEVVKSLFNDSDFKNKNCLGSVNSFNFCRLMVQSAHFIYSYLQKCDPERIGSQKVIFSIPTGAFGNAISCFFAVKMGLPVEKLIACSNTNEATYNLLKRGKFDPKEVVCTLAPAIDIQVPYNVERFFYLTIAEENAEKLKTIMKLFEKKELQLSESELQNLNEFVIGQRLSDEEIKEEMKSHYERTENIICPHTAVALGGLKKAIQEKPTGLNWKCDPITVCIATAHPSKFDKATMISLSLTAKLPDHVPNFLLNSQEFEIQTDMENADNIIRNTIIECTKKHN